MFNLKISRVGASWPVGLASWKADLVKKTPHQMGTRKRTDVLCLNFRVRTHFESR